MFRLKYYNWRYTRALKCWLSHLNDSKGRKLFIKVKKYSALVRKEEQKYDNTRDET